MTKPIPVTPKTDHPLPFEDTDDVAPSFIEQMAVAGRTAELQAALGAPIELSRADGKEATALLKQVIANHDTAPLQDRGTALAALAFLREYGSMLAFDVAQARNAITNKLMELADCGDRKIELRALELLGKHSDIGLFTERSEITIRHKSSGDLEAEIKARLQRLLHAEVFDTVPVGVASVADEDVWGEATVKALDAIKPMDHPGWVAPTRAARPEGVPDPYEGMDDDDTDDDFTAGDNFDE